MDDPVKPSLNQALGAAVLKLLRPLVRVLLQHGMAYGTFAEIARKAYVEEGFEYIADSGKRPTISSVSALSGLTRKETKRLRELGILDDEGSSQRYNRAIRVVSAWTCDTRFMTLSGAPAILPIEGAENSFSALVKEFSGDIPTAAMLSVLQSSNTVEINGGDVQLLEKAFIPSATPLDKINILGADVAELVDTIGHNLIAPPEDLFFQRKVSNMLLHPDAIPAFKELSNRKSQLLLEEYDTWLSQHEVHVDNEVAVEQRYVAVGIYYSEYLEVGKDPS